MLRNCGTPNKIFVTKVLTSKKKLRQNFFLRTVKQKSIYSYTMLKQNKKTCDNPSQEVHVNIYSRTLSDEECH